MPPDVETPPEIESGSEIQTPVQSTGRSDFTSGVKTGFKLNGGIIKGLKLTKKKLFIGGAIVGVVAGLVAIFLLLSLFKNVHIENLFIDYEFAKFNNAYQERMDEAVKEAQTEATGTADTTVDPAASPIDQLKGMNQAEIEQLGKDPETLQDATQTAEELDRSQAGSGGVVGDEMGINWGIEGDETGKTDAEVTADTNKAVTEDASAGETAQSPPTDAVSDATSDAQTAIDNGAAAGSPELAQAAEQGFSRGLNGVAAKIAGPGMLVTLGCVARSIYVTGWHAFAQTILGGNARTAASHSKYADCQKSGTSNCSLAQIGAVANQCDDGQTSCSNAADYQAASGEPVTGPALPSTYQPGATPTTNSDLVNNLISFGGHVDSVFSIPGVGKGCSLILSKPGQAAIIGVGAATTIAGFVSDAADFGLSTVAQAAGTGALAVVGTVAGKALALKAALYYGGLLYKAPITGVLLGNVLGAGNKTIASDSCRINGCVQLTQQQNTTLTLAAEHDQTVVAGQKGLAYQLFSPHYSRSALGLLADRTPTNPQAALADLHQFSATIFNPGRLITAVINLLTPSKAEADAVPFGSDGLPDYGMPETGWNIVANTQWVQQNMGPSDFAKYDPCFTDPMVNILTNTDSSGNAKDYSYCNNQSDQMLTHYREYKLDQRVTHDMVLLYNNQPGTQTDATQAANSTTPPSGNAAQLATQLLANHNFIASGRDVKQDLTLTSQGQPGTAGAPLSVAILQLLTQLAASHTVRPSAIESGGTGHCNGQSETSCPGDPHYTGDAADIDQLDGVSITGRNAPALTIMNVAFTVLPSGSRFGQKQCGADPALPDGFSDFDDSCNHLHVDVPKGTP